MSFIHGHKFVQNCWVVTDLDQAMRHWTETCNVGPFFVIPHVQVEEVRYRGKPAELDFSGALAQAGDVQIELIVQHNDGPSAYRDLYPAGKSGFHHMCIVADDYDQELARYRDQGFVPATEGRFGTMRFRYVDTLATLGFMVEIVDRNASMLAGFKRIADAAQDWDGSRPIRPASEFMQPDAA